MKKVLGVMIMSLLVCIVNSVAQRYYRVENNSTGLQNDTPVLSVKRIRLATGVELEYAEQGNANGVPVILLHGFTDSWQSFGQVLPHLPASLHVIALSQRGHGNSSKTAASFKPEDFAKDVADFIKEKRLSSAVIVGHSMGSTNAQCFASRYPELTTALVLVGSFAAYDKPMIHEFKKVIDELNDPVDSSFIAEFQTSTITRPISPAMLQTFINESLRVPAHVWKGVAAGWNDAGYLKTLQVFDKPALIIWGDKDAYCPKDDQVLLNKALENSKLLVYEGTGHATQWEEPVRFANDLAGFVLKLPDHRGN